MERETLLIQERYDAKTGKKISYALFEWDEERGSVCISISSGRGSRKGGLTVFLEPREWDYIHDALKTAILKSGRNGGWR